MRLFIQSLTCILTLISLHLPSVTSEPLITTGSLCNLTVKCPYLHTCNNHRCLHKIIWPPTGSEIAGTFLLFIIVGLGNAGGIGGVFLIRPVLVYLLKYSLESANELSYSLLFGGMLGGYIFRVWRREPTTAKPVIHYEISLVSLPILIFGANLGSILSRVFPAIVDFLIQIYFLTMTFVIMCRNYKKIRDQENKIFMSPRQVIHHGNIVTVDDPEITCEAPEKKPENNSGIAIESNNILTQSTRLETEGHPEIGDKIKKEAAKAKILADIVIEEHRLFPLKKNLELMAIMSCYVILFLLRGNYYSNSIAGVEKCSWLFWFFYCLVFPLSVIFHIKASRLITKEHKRRKSAGYKFKEKFIMTPEKMPYLRKICLMSGFLTSISGIGIGVRLISGLMVMGMQPYSAIATSGYFVLFVSITYLSVIFGSVLLTMGDIFYYMVLSFLAGFIVTFILFFCIKRHRASINMLSLLIVIVLGIMAGFFGIIYRGIQNPKALLFPGDICKIN
jgi:uncharacterized membrane protein YfcA